MAGNRVGGRVPGRGGLARDVSLAALVAAGGVACCAGVGGASAVARRSRAARGSLTVLENPLYGNWTGLDPALSTTTGSFMDAIYGDLFEIGPNGTLVDDLATGYTLSKSGKVFTISLRRGVKFSDGTPFNASAVAASIRRDVDPANACTCAANLPVAFVSTPNATTVRVVLSRPDGAIPYAFADAAPSWIPSPTALAKEGKTAFALNPVGAGPFEVASDLPGSKLVLRRNPHYWQKGAPQLQSLTFETTASDQTAYDAVTSGQAQAYQDLTTFSLLPQAKQSLNATAVPNALGTFVVQLNTKVPPFNNVKAREAIYYATNAAALSKGLTGGLGVVTESPTEPGGLFFTPKVPGYRNFGLRKARALVKQLGGLNVSLETGSQEIDQELEIALKDQWAQAGIQTTVGYGPLATVVQNFRGGKWQAFLQQAGGFSPALGIGLPFRFESTGPFSGIRDHQLDYLIKVASERVVSKVQTRSYDAVFTYIAKHAYAPFLFAVPQFNITAKSVSGPGLTTDQYQVFWQDVTVK